MFATSETQAALCLGLTVSPPRAWWGQRWPKASVAFHGKGSRGGPGSGGNVTHGRERGRAVLFSRSRLLNASAFVFLAVQMWGLCLCPPRGKEVRTDTFLGNTDGEWRSLVRKGERSI